MRRLLVALVLALTVGTAQVVETGQWYFHAGALV